MRQYRGLTKEGKWVYGWYVESESNKKAYIVTSATGYNESPTEIKHLQAHGKIYIHEYYRVIPKTVGQFTSLKDKNGKEIYEGDLLRIPAKDKWEETNYSAFEVFFHDNDCADRHIGFQMNRMHNYGAVVGGCCNYPFLPKTTAKFEIIGNIHQNPELMESI